MELADVDEIKSTSANEINAIADSELKIKHNNYLTLNFAFNHNAALIARAREDMYFTLSSGTRTRSS